MEQIITPHTTIPDSDGVRVKNNKHNIGTNESNILQDEEEIDYERNDEERDIELISPNVVVKGMGETQKKHIVLS